MTEEKIYPNIKEFTNDKKYSLAGGEIIRFSFNEDKDVPLVFKANGEAISFK